MEYDQSPIEQSARNFNRLRLANRSPSIKQPYARSVSEQATDYSIASLPKSLGEIAASATKEAADATPQRRIERDRIRKVTMSAGCRIMQAIKTPENSASIFAGNRKCAAIGLP